MSDSDSESSCSDSTAADGDVSQRMTPGKDSDPRLLFRRPRRKGLLRPGGMTVTYYNGSRRYIYANPDNDPWSRLNNPSDTDPPQNDSQKDDLSDSSYGEGDAWDSEGQRKEERGVQECPEEEEEEGKVPKEEGVITDRVMVVRRRRHGPAAQEGEEEEVREEAFRTNTEDAEAECTAVGHHADNGLSSDSEFYDTDLDPETTVTQMFQSLKPPQNWPGEEEDEVEEEDSMTDLVRRAEYMRTCFRQRATPQSAIWRHLDKANLDLRHRNVGTHNLKPLFAALKNNLKVQRLLLDENGVTAEGADCLALGLVDNVTVAYLSLSDNPLGREGLAPLVRLLLTNNIIQGINLSNTKLRGDSVPLLCHLLKENTTLKFLDVSRNVLEENLIRLLAAAIGENSGLQFLRLSSNNLRLSGAAAIGQCLTVNECLRVLDLSWNGLGYQGAVAMAKSLRKNGTLQELDISHNNINWKGALVLASALANNSTLRILRAGGNTITTTGANDLVEAASSPLSQLRLLDISDVCVIPDTEVLASSINQFRPFRLHHGGVVFMSDVIGRRLARERQPMERLLGHLKDRMIRPLELLRQFDKHNAGKVTVTQFVARMRKENVPLHDFEIRALAASMSDIEKEGDIHIDYKKLIDSVEQHIWQERMRKIRERLYARRLRQYHHRILKDGTPLFSASLPFSLDSPHTPDPLTSSWGRLSSPTPSTDRLSLVTGRSGPRAGESSWSLLSLATGQAEAPALAPLKKTRNRFTMSQPLQEIGVKAKKKSKVRKKKRSRTALPKETVTMMSALRAGHSGGV